MEKELPKGWILIQLGDLFLIERGGSPRPIEDYITQAEDGINWIKIGDTKGLTKYIYKTKEKIKPEGLYKSRMVYEDDFILSNSMSFGHPYIMKTSGCIHDGWLVIRPNKKIVDLNFLYYMLSSSFVYQQFTSLAKGSTVKNLNIVAVQQVYIFLPPLPEQQRIVTKLDTLFGQLDKIKTHLERIQQLLKDFRQKVLTQAVTGKLTEEWREGKELDEWKIEIASVCCNNVQSGGTPKGGGFSDEGIPFLKVYNIVNNQIDFEYRPQFVTIEVQNKALSKSIAYPGDVLMNIVGPPLNKIAILPTDYPEWNLNQAITLFRTKEYLMNSFLYYYFCEGKSVREVMGETKGVVGQVNISLSQCRDFEIPIPPLEEQQEIVRRIESLLAKAHKIEDSYQILKAKIDQLPQSLLAKAFRGELVEQLSTDGDARDLLEEIKKLKGEGKGAGKGKKLNRKEELDVAAEPEKGYGKK